MTGWGWSRGRTARATGILPAGGTGAASRLRRTEAAKEEPPVRRSLCCPPCCSPLPLAALHHARRAHYAGAARARSAFVEERKLPGAPEVAVPRPASGVLPPARRTRVLPAGPAADRQAARAGRRAAERSRLHADQGHHAEDGDGHGHGGGRQVQGADLAADPDAADDDDLRHRHRGQEPCGRVQDRLASSWPPRSTRAAASRSRWPWALRPQDRGDEGPEDVLLGEPQGQRARRQARHAAQRAPRGAADHERDEPVVRVDGDAPPGPSRSAWAPAGRW